MKRHDGEADGGSAFPSHGSMGEVEHRGMSLHEWYAGQAFPVVAAALMGAMNGGTTIDERDFPLLVARLANKAADAMLAERERRKGTSRPS